MILHLAQPEVQRGGFELAARLDELEGGFILGGGFNEAGLAHPLGLRIMEASTRMFFGLRVGTTMARGSGVSDEFSICRF